MSPITNFCGAAFAADGELLGTRTRPISELSPKWLKICDELIEFHGPVFKTSLGQNLSHIGVSVTSASGAALCTFSVHGSVTLTTAYFLGMFPSAESELQAVMLASLRNTHLVQAAAESDKPFESLLGLQQRPLCVFVFWAPDGVSEQDNDLVREFGEHLAGAFFMRGSRTVA
jgi:hypothetical protein